MRDHEGSTCQNVDLLSQSRAEHFTISRSKVKTSLYRRTWRQLSAGTLKMATLGGFGVWQTA